MKRYPLFFLVMTLLLIIISIRSATPPEPVKANGPDTVFSSQRAFTYLNEIARAPHMIGTTEHERVRQYIINSFRKMGIPAETQESTVLTRRGEFLAAANVSNIIARIKGKVSAKAILLAAHYDSQPNTPGAGDDGMGVASLLETAHALTSGPRLQNDVILLATDGEEEGLYGAKAFVKEYAAYKDVVVVVNWDFRGNGGSVITYETSPENGWIMRQYAKGVPHPVASSMAYEVSKLLPNFTDFTPFKNTGVTGFTNGAIDGFVNYHSMTDRPENLDPGIVQQLGDNMLGITKQLGNVSLENTRAPDLSFVNIIGYQVIYYPAAWNLFLSIAATILFFIGIISVIRQHKIKPAGFVVSFLVLPLIAVATVFASDLSRKAILKAYPLYSHFDENNAYNSSWYFLAMAILSVLLFLLIFKPCYKRWGYMTTFTAILANMIILMWVSWIFIRSAAFLFEIPCLFLAAGLILTGTDKFSTGQEGLHFQLTRFVSVLPALLLFAPFCNLLFVTFGLGAQMPFVAVTLVLFAALLYPVLANIFDGPRWMAPSIGLSVMVISIFTAHAKSGFDKQHPLQTNVRYRLNADDSTADWLSDFMVTDHFSERFFPDRKTDTAFKDGKRLIHAAPLLDYPPPVLSILKDTVLGETREITMNCSSIRAGVTAIGIMFDDGNKIDQISVNGIYPENQKPQNPVTKSLVCFAPPKEGFVISLRMKSADKAGLMLFDRSMGLPVIKNLTEYPEDIIPGTNFNSNTVMVRKHFLL